MGSIHSNLTPILRSNNSNHSSSISRPQSILSICTPKNDFFDKRRQCSKKKVLILGLDGVGKTDLFTRLVSADRQRSKVGPFPRPTLGKFNAKLVIMLVFTIGYNVETIKIHCHHFYHRQYHKITLWDCGGESSVRTLWPYHYSNTSLLLWTINIHDRLRLDTNLQLLSQTLTSPSLYQVPVLIVLYDIPFEHDQEEKSDGDMKQNLLTNLEVAFRFLATLSTSRASTFKWQVINVKFDEHETQNELKKIRQCFKELMEL